MAEAILNKLDTLIQTIPGLLAHIDEVSFSLKPAPDKWSKKEILGHLIDSATNNHQRFIRGQYEHLPTISYDQDQWNKLNRYTEMDSKHIIAFWTVYNKHLLEIMKRIPNENLHKCCRSSNGNTHTIEFLMEDYVGHLEHHLRQIVSY
jgi:DinB superfamily